MHLPFRIDLGCSDCLNSWPLLTEVYETYGDTVKFNYRLMPLPYHQYAFMLAKSAFVVDTYGESGDVFSFFDTVYTSENQGRIYNGATNDLSYNDVMNDIVAEFVTNATNIDADQYIQGMDASVCGACEMNARYSFKNAALRGVYGTPMQQVNGVLVDGLDEMEDWKQVLDSLVN